MVHMNFCLASPEVIDVSITLLLTDYLNLYQIENNLSFLSFVSPTF